MHPTNFISTSPVFYSTKKQCGFSFVIEDKYDEMPPVFIGADCFIGANSVILNGLSLGIGCVVASGSVVTKDVPPYAIVAGSPARIVKMRFPYHIIDNLLKSEWWTNEPNELLKNPNVFSSPYTEQHIFNL
jgi:acetyltransferase-like isoleucine patch superfamily enzyme